MSTTRNSNETPDPTKNGVFTLFLLGTGERYYNPNDPRNDPDSGKFKKKFAKNVINNKNIHTSFYEACLGEKLLLDGPQGARDPKRINKMIELSAEAIQNFVANSPPGEDGKYRININGFSRGGACCARVANKLQAMVDNGELKDAAGKTLTLNDIEVNICASDPVAGLLDKKDKDAKEIPPIVKNYVALLQIDEKRRAFLPEDLSRVKILDPNNTQVTFLPMHGNHTETNRVKSPDVKHGVLLHYNIKFAFLTQHGTTFKDNKLPPIAVLGDPGFVKPEDNKLQSPEMLLEYYANVKANKAIYEKRGNDFLTAQAVDVPGKKNDRSFATTYKADYVKDDFFLNQHERELFKKLYPKTFNCLFERGIKDENDPRNTGGILKDTNKNGGFTNKSLHAELEKIMVNNPLLMEQLISAKKIAKGFNDPKFPYILNVGGIPEIEPCRYLNSTCGLPVKPLSVAELLRIKVSEDIFSLKREKGDISNFEAGLMLREKLDAITTSGVSSEDKFNAVMSVLTEEAKLATKNKNSVQLKILSNAINFATAEYSKPDDRSENINILDKLSRMSTAVSIDTPAPQAAQTSKELAMAANEDMPPQRLQRQNGLMKLSGTESAVTESLSIVAKQTQEQTLSETSPAKAAAKALACEPLEESPSLRRERQHRMSKRSGIETAVADTVQNRVSSPQDALKDKAEISAPRIRIGGR